MDLSKFKRFDQLTKSEQKGSGIYAHIYNNDFAYIGFTKNLQKRRIQHGTNFNTGNFQQNYYNRIKILSKESEFYKQRTNPLILKCQADTSDEAHFIKLFIEAGWQLYNSRINTNLANSKELYCSNCKQFKLRELFKTYKKAEQGLCRECANAKNNKYLKNNPHKNVEAVVRWQKANREKYREYQRSRYWYLKKLKQSMVK